MGKVGLSSSLCSFASDVGIIVFDGPGVACTYGYDVATAVGSGVGNWRIGTGGNGFIHNCWPWVDGNGHLEGFSHAVSCCSGSRRDCVGDRLRLAGDID